MLFFVLQRRNDVVLAVDNSKRENLVPVVGQKGGRRREEEDEGEEEHMHTCTCSCSNSKSMGCLWSLDFGDLRA